MNQLTSVIGSWYFWSAREIVRIVTTIDMKPSSYTICHKHLETLMAALMTQHHGAISIKTFIIDFMPNPF